MADHVADNVTGYGLDDLLYLMSRLRDPEDGCPWDRVQDFSSIAPHTIEESYELVDAIDSGDFQQIREELGDVLFQVVFYAQLGKEQARFDFTDIISTLVDKLIRRHPHVFPEGTLQSRADGQVIDTAKIKQHWEQTKAIERQQKNKTGVLDDVPVTLPALSRAAKLQKRASQVGFDWSDDNGEAIDAVLSKIQEEIGELQEARRRQKAAEIEGELGDILFSVVNLARHLSIDPETALRSTNRKFESRFRYIEQTLVATGQAIEKASLATMDALWDEAKKQGL